MEFYPKTYGKRSCFACIPYSTTVRTNHVVRVKCCAHISCIIFVVGKLGNITLTTFSIIRVYLHKSSSLIWGGSLTKNGGRLVAVSPVPLLQMFAVLLSADWRDNHSNFNSVMVRLVVVIRDLLNLFYTVFSARHYSNEAFRNIRNI